MVPTHHTCDYTIPNHTVWFTYYAIPYFAATYCQFSVSVFNILLINVDIQNVVNTRKSIACLADQNIWTKSTKAYQRVLTLRFFTTCLLAKYNIICTIKCHKIIMRSHEIHHVSCYHALSGFSGLSKEYRSTRCPPSCTCTFGTVVFCGSKWCTTVSQGWELVKICY